MDRIRCGATVLRLVALVLAALVTFAPLLCSPAAASAVIPLSGAAAVDSGPTMETAVEIPTDGNPVYCPHYFATYWMKFPVQSGHVYDIATFSPFYPDAIVNLYDGSGAAPEARFLQSVESRRWITLSGTDGYYYLSHYPSGARSDGVVETYTITVREYEPSYISGIVRTAPEGQPVGGALVKLWRYGNSMWWQYPLATTLTAPDGSYRFTVAPGEYAIGFSDPSLIRTGEYYSGMSGARPYDRVTCVTVGETTQVAGIDGRLLARSRVTGRVVRSTDGSGIGGITVWNRDDDANVSTVTGPDGSFSFEGVDAGLEHELVWSGTPEWHVRANETRRYSVATGGQYDTTLTLYPGGAITGVVTDALTGRRLPGIEVARTRYAGVPEVVLQSTTTDENGEYRFDNISDGSSCVRFHDPAGIYSDRWVDSYNGRESRLVGVALGESVVVDEAMFPDTEPPVAGAVSGPIVATGAATVVIEAHDVGRAGMGRIEWSPMAIGLELGPQVYNGPLVFDGDMAFTLHYRAVDAAGNKSPAQSVRIVVDHNAPTIGVRYTFHDRQPAVVSITANDSASGIAKIVYTVDGVTAESTSTDFDLGFLRPRGTHVLTAYAVDNVGRTSITRSQTFDIPWIPFPPADTLVPVTTWPGHAPEFAGKADVVLRAEDPTSLIDVAYTMHAIDGETPSTGSTFTVTGVGEHTIRYWSVDWYGNVEAEKTATFTVVPQPVDQDKTAPVTMWSQPSSLLPPPVTIRLLASDPGGSGVAATWFRVNGGAAIASDTVCLLEAGTHTVEYWSIDAAGNEEAHITRQVTVLTPTRLSIYKSRTTVYKGRSVSLYGWLSPYAADRTHVHVWAKPPGSSSWVEISVRHTYKRKWSYTWYPTKRGTWYVQARYVGSSKYAPSISSSEKIVVK